MSYCDLITRHYEAFWSARGERRTWTAGPRWELPSEFKVARFEPSREREAWTYATVCMSQPTDESPVELHLFSPVETDQHVELLTVVAHYHRTGARLGLGHTVNFGRSWLPGSECSYGLISRPYLDGPELETAQLGNHAVQCLWLLPITKREVEFKKKHGLEALEERFESAGLDYLNSKRPSVV